VNRGSRIIPKGRSALVLTAIAVGLAACSSSSPSGSGTQRTLIVGTSNDAPFAFHDAGATTLKGIDGQMIEAIAKRKGWKIQIYDTDFSTLIPALQAKKIDVVADAMYITDTRKKVVNFTNPWYSEGEGIVTRGDTSGISGAADLKGKVVGAQTGTVYLDYAKTLGASNLRIFDSQAALLQALQNKQVDAVVTDSAVAGYAIAKDPKSGLKLLLPNPPHFPGTIGAAVRKEDTALLADLNDGLAVLKASGEDLTILKQFGLGEANRQK
jgi:polar amino acid transport system substrate-binding protein